MKRAHHPLKQAPTALSYAQNGILYDQNGIQYDQMVISQILSYNLQILLISLSQPKNTKSFLAAGS